MKTAVNLFLWTDFVQEEHLKHFTELKQAGYDGVEIPLLMGEAAHYQRFARAIQDEGLECIATSNCMPDKNLISVDASERQRAIDHLKWAVDMSHILDSRLIGGPIHSTPGQFTGEPPTKNEQGWAAEGLHQVATYSLQNDIHLAVEYLNRFESYLACSMQITLDLVQAVDHSHVGIHLDTHHAHYEENDIAAAIILAKGHIKHVQLSESNRGTAGKGLINFAEVVEALKQIAYDQWITIEAFSDKNPTLVKALHLWRPLYESEEEVYRAGIHLIKKLWWELLTEPSQLTNTKNC